MKNRINRVVLAMTLLIIAVVVIVDTDTYSWLFHGWQSGDSRVTFSAANTVDPRLTMWTYDFTSEGAPSDGWSVKYQDTAADNETDKTLPAIADSAGSNSLTGIDRLQLQFGNLDSLVDIEKNSVYLRFEVKTNANSINDLLIDYSLQNEDGSWSYLKLYRGSLNSDSATNVSGSLITTLNSTLDSGLAYPFIKAYYAVSDLAYAPNNNGNGNLEQLFPTTGNESHRLSDSINFDEITNFCDNSGTTSEKTRYLYIKIMPDVEGIIKAYKDTSIKAQGPCYAVLDITLNIESHIREVSQ